MFVQFANGKSVSWLIYIYATWACKKDDVDILSVWWLFNILFSLKGEQSKMMLYHQLYKYWLNDRSAVNGDTYSSSDYNWHNYALFENICTLPTMITAGLYLPWPTHVDV